MTLLEEATAALARNMAELASMEAQEVLQRAEHWHRSTAPSVSAVEAECRVLTSELRADIIRQRARVRILELVHASALAYPEFAFDLTTIA